VTHLPAQPALEAAAMQGDLALNVIADHFMISYLAALEDIAATASISPT
jgi:hypothetical protein